MIIFELGEMSKEDFAKQESQITEGNDITFEVCLNEEYKPYEDVILSFLISKKDSFPEIEKHPIVFNYYDDPYHPTITFYKSHPASITYLCREIVCEVGKYICDNKLNGK